METIIGEKIDIHKKNTRDVENGDAENIESVKSYDSSYSQDLKNYTTIQLNEGIEIPENPLSLHEINKKNDIPLYAQEFSDLTDPLFIKKICLEKVNDWNHLTEDDICVKQILRGLTNQLFEVCLKEDQAKKNHRIRKHVLFRIYGKDVSELYNPVFELEVYKTMSKFNIAPLLINTYNGGRIEEWLYGDPLSTYDLKNPSILVVIANLLGKFHTLSCKATFPAHWEKIPCIYKMMEKWKNRVLKYNDLDKLGFDVNKYAKESDNYIKFIREYTQLDNIAHDIVFCHNDLQENNIMRTNKCLRLIDFEYSNYNYLSSDIANLFNETAIDYSVSTYPFFTIDKKKYISYESRKLFVSTYLHAYLGKCSISSDEKVISEFLDAVKVQELGTHLLWGFWSIIRGFQTKSYNEFDFFLYAKERFNIYYEQKEYMISNKIIQDY